MPFQSPVDKLTACLECITDEPQSPAGSNKTISQVSQCLSLDGDNLEYVPASEDSNYDYSMIIPFSTNHVMKQQFVSSNKQTSASSTGSDGDNSEYVPASEDSNSDYSMIIPFPTNHGMKQQFVSSNKRTSASSTEAVDSVQLLDDKALEPEDTAQTTAGQVSQNIPLDNGAFECIPNSSETITIPCVSSGDQSVTSRSKKKRIPRPCVFCGLKQTNLRRHITTVHKADERVKDSLQLPGRQQSKFFKQLRKEGIWKHNKVEMMKEKPAYECERRKSKDRKLVKCGDCSGFYSKSYFARHKKNCMGDRAQPPSAVPVELLATCARYSLSDKFKSEILARFSNDKVGNLCKSDKAIVRFGSRMFGKMKAKQDKAAEVKRSVMADMRRLGYLYLQFMQECYEAEMPVVVDSSLDMLSRDKFSYFEAAIQSYTSQNETIKAGLKSSLFYLLKRFSHFARAQFLIEGDDCKAEEVNKFVEVFELHKNEIFGDATYILNRKRQENLRRPEQLPKEPDVEKLKQYTVQRISELVSDEYLIWDAHLFVELRDLLVSRLTLFNARRGGEPARLLITEWSDAENNSWIGESQLESMGCDIDMNLISDMKVAYQEGKGNNHLVPVLFPLDTISAMQKLLAVRDSCGILPSNRYMFACVQSADTHVNGWHAVRRVCTDAGIEDIEKMTATKMRHRISTLYAAMDVPQNERNHFYKHMGHSADINANIYQVPLAAAEIIMVGSRLQQLDGSSAAAKVTCCATGYTTSTTTIHSVDDNAVQLEETAPAQVTYRDDSNTTREAAPASRHFASPSATTSVRQKKSQSPRSFASTTEAVCSTQTLDLESVPTLYPSVSRPACLGKMRSSSSARKVTHSPTGTAPVQNTQILELESPAASTCSVTLPTSAPLPRKRFKSSRFQQRRNQVIYSSSDSCDSSTASEHDHEQKNTSKFTKKVKGKFCRHLQIKVMTSLSK